MGLNQAQVAEAAGGGCFTPAAASAHGLGTQHAGWTAVRMQHLSVLPTPKGALAHLKLQCEALRLPREGRVLNQRGA